MVTVEYLVNKLQLEPHPEGGYFKETYRADLKSDFNGFEGERNVSTGIYFLLEQLDFSAFHKIQSDEMWHFYDGDTMEVHMIFDDGTHKVVKLGRDLEKGELLQFVVPAGVWFGSRVAKGGDFSLVGCTVAPGFDFKDFEMPTAEVLLERFPKQKGIIEEMTRK
ncbi:cupin domain-containing protein [Fulvivirga ligni]|uniref:cupin domain-containing protein n=1 Tax=Fulvivirga ligni TaxID=2904246 RepID=UPI001F331498|nr:cupin domain-containing protein [Fulvivirga ligni]UII23970.1 cupin domain-containing protein [Fulvivirga ligni]